MNREAGDLRRYRAHYDVILMIKSPVTPLIVQPFVQACIKENTKFHFTGSFAMGIDRWIPFPNGH